MQHSTRRFGRVPRNRFSCICDMEPCGIEYTLQSTGRSGYLAVPLSSALMWAICTAGLNVAYLRTRDRNRKARDRNRKSRVRNRKSRYRNRKSRYRNRKSRDLNRKSRYRNRKSILRNRKSRDRNRKSCDRNRKSRDRNRKSRDRNRKSSDRSQNGRLWALMRITNCAPILLVRSYIAQYPVLRNAKSGSGHQCCEKTL